MEKLRILIVDDQQLFAEGLRHVIEGESEGRLEVVGIAEDGKAAVKDAEQLTPDVILMDVRMPVMDGVEATRLISRNHPDIRIMILTTFDDDELVFDALSAGANGYVLKNIDPKDIVPAIEAVRTGALFVSPSVGFRLIDTGNPKHITQDGKSTIVEAIIDKLPTMTIREAEVIDQMLRARRNHEIAEALFISEKTVRNHISTIYEKLGIHNRLRLMSFFSEVGITSSSLHKSKMDIQQR